MDDITQCSVKLDHLYTDGCMWCGVDSDTSISRLTRYCAFLLNDEIDRSATHTYIHMYVEGNLVET